jgi:hypothetical protein
LACSEKAIHVFQFAHITDSKAVKHKLSLNRTFTNVQYESFFEYASCAEHLQEQLIFDCANSAIEDFRKNLDVDFRMLSNLNTDDGIDKLSNLANQIKLTASKYSIRMVVGEPTFYGDTNALPSFDIGSHWTLWLWTITTIIINVSFFFNNEN